MLIALVTGQRCQSFHLMDLDSMQQNSDHCKFVIKDLVKQSAPGRKQPVLILPAFKEDFSICVYSVLTDYIKRTAPRRGGQTGLFIGWIGLRTPYHVGLRLLRYSSLIVLELLLQAKQIHVRCQLTPFFRQLPGKVIVLSVSLITNPLKIMFLSLVRLFLALAQGFRLLPCYAQSQFFLCSLLFMFNKLLHLQVWLKVLLGFYTFVSILL